jgi:hypothetical protein
MHYKANAGNGTTHNDVVLRKSGTLYLVQDDYQSHVMLQFTSDYE